jgi:hypothetical protein
VYYGRCAFRPPKPHVATDPVYIVLMNETISTMTTTHLLGTRPMGDWFTALNDDIQGDIMEMVNEAGYPLDDIRDFIETYGAHSYANGHYVTWCQLEEELGASTLAVRAFVEEFGIDAIDGFEDAYYGEYASEAEFAEEYATGDYNVKVPDFVVIDWQATWDTNLSYNFTYNNGYVFRSTY